MMSYLLDVINAVNSGFKLAKNEYGIESGLILCGMRHDPQNVIDVLVVNTKT